MYHKRSRNTFLPFTLGAILLFAGSFSHLGSTEEEDVLTSHDNRGNISTVYNLFDGQSHSIQITRLNAAGVILWSDQHYDNNYEKAYASAMDAQGGLYIAGVRRQYGQKYMLTLKYANEGYLAWEIVDNQYDCTAVAAVTDQKHNVIVAGVCRNGEQFPARLLKYDSQGGLLWIQDYDGGGRNYVRDLQSDFYNNINMTVETVYGNYRDGSYTTRTLIYDEFGQLIDER